MINQLLTELEMRIDALNEKITPDASRAARVQTILLDFKEKRKVPDFRFDSIYPAAIRKLSGVHWTPVEVALRATELLVSRKRAKVLDVGSGCGKFCTVGALSSNGQFIGIERRGYLVEVAKSVAQDLGAHDASFIQGDMRFLDWSYFDSIYLFNPFYESTLKVSPIDSSVPIGLDQFHKSIEIVRTKLSEARAGTKVVTYHGFGGEMPLGYERVLKEPICTSFLELWVKRKKGEKTGDLR